MKQLFIYFSLLLSCFAVAQNQPSAVIPKITTSVKLDGVIDNNEWSKANKIANFYSHQPYDTAYAQTKTEVWICYDEKNIYVAAKCYDSLPDRDFIIQSLKRDFSYPRSDAFSVILDPVNDKTNGFSFAVNPFGAQREGLISNGGRYGVTTSWDNKWFSKVKQYTGYWIVEMAIPFKSIRYKENITSWGINFSRNNLKINESSAWSPVKRQFNIATLPNIGKLIWSEPPPKTGLNYSIIPYVSSSANKDYVAGTNTKHQLQIGGDAKLAITPSLNLDVTINPDYSQVEVDRQVTNLTQFSIFFPEQRRFFIENSDLFSGFGFRDLTPFYSRQIGVKRQNGATKQIPIIGGLRLSGKINKNWRLGLLNMQTNKEERDSLELNSYNYSGLAVQRQLWKNSNIAAFVANKQSFDKAIHLNNNLFNRVAGLDFNYISKNNQLKAKTFSHHSFIQSNPKNSRTHGLEAEFANKNILTSIKHEYANKNYVAESGFNPRLSIGGGKTYSSIITKFEYKFYPKSDIIIKHGPGIHHKSYLNSSLDVTQQITDVFYAIDFQNKAKLSGGYKTTKDSLFFARDITRTGSTPLNAGFYNYDNYGISYTSDERKLLFWIQKLENGEFYNGKKFTSQTELKYRYQPWGIFSLTYDYNKIDLPTTYFSGNLHLAGAKAELSFSKSVFFSTFLQYNTQRQNVNINSRFQWRFRPMSDLFIVYTDNYDSVNLDVKNRGLIAKFVYWW